MSANNNDVEVTVQPGQQLQPIPHTDLRHPAFPGPGQIYGRMAAAMQDIFAVPKGQTNEFHKYKFRGIDDVLAMVHPILARHGIFCVPNIMGEPKVVERASTKGKAELHTVVTVRWTIYAPDGSFIEASTLGEAADTGDKGCNKAMSASQKYFFIQAFSIPVKEDDRDTENRSPEFAAHAQKSAAVDDYMRQGEKPSTPPPAVLTASDLIALMSATKTPDELAGWKLAHKKDMARIRKQDPAGFARIVEKGKALAERAKWGHDDAGEGPEPPDGVLQSDREPGEDG